MQQKIMLVDGNSIVNRASVGVPLLTNHDGIYTNAVYGFMNILFKMLDEEKPDYLAVAFDLHAPTFRHRTYDAYKAGRKEMPTELRGQMPILKEMLSAMGICQYAMEGFEADDILGTLSKIAEDQGIAPVIVSGDRDMLQLASDTLKVCIPKTKGGKTETENYYAADVVAKYGVTPTEFIDMKALMGDTSDNIPGVPGIGEKTASKIIQAYHTVEEAIAHAEEIKPKKASENLVAYADQARLSYYLAKIVRNVPLELNLEQVKIGNLFTPAAYEMAKKLEFKSMLSRFENQTQNVVSAENVFTYQFIQTAKELEELIQNLPKEEIAYRFFAEDHQVTGLSLYCPKKNAFWIEVSQTLPVETLMKMTAVLFQDQEYALLGSDVKSEIHLLRFYGIEPQKVAFDAAIAAYLLNPLQSEYAYDTLAKDFLGEIVPSEEEILGKGKSKKSLKDLLPEERALFCAKQAEVIYRLYPVLLEKLKETEQLFLYREIELPLIYVLADMEQVGIKIDRHATEDFQARLSDAIDSVSAEIYEMTGEVFNLNSPKQLGEILFEKMGLKGGKKTKTGYSTAADVLEKLKTKHPVIEKILYYRQLAKLKSTYADGLLTVANPENDRIYSTFNQTITATGRISSSEPNLQNIPIRLELGRELRKVFIPEDESYCFLDADYSQIELRVLAHISQDPTLIEAFRTGQDIHRLTASQVFHVPFEEVTARQRSNAKAVNFGIVYGIGAFSLSQDLGISRKEAEQYIEGYFTKYPKIRDYMTQTIEQATENGYVSTMYHRRRPMPELKSNQFAQHAFGERVAMNMPIQGSAADIIKIAMIRVHHALKEGNYRSRLVLQVHDELLIETYLEEKEAVAQILRDNMEQAAQLAVPLEVDVHAGKSWFDAK